MIEEGIATYLLSKTGITNLVDDRINFSLAPQGEEFPQIGIAKTSGPRVHSHSGSSGLAHPRYQFHCWAATYAAAKSLADALRLVMDGYKGAMGGESIGAVLFLDEGDVLEIAAGNEAQRLHGIRQDYTIWHGETVPTF